VRILSIIALVGLATNAFFGIRWADPVSALAITPLIIWEAREALRGKPCSCR
jgi:divalent metal cation (Fe/Co/Zn/Cd) transporter